MLCNVLFAYTRPSKHIKKPTFSKVTIEVLNLRFLWYKESKTIWISHDIVLIGIEGVFECFPSWINVVHVCPNSSKWAKRMVVWYFIPMSLHVRLGITHWNECKRNITESLSKYINLYCTLPTNLFYQSWRFHLKILQSVTWV